MTYWLMGAGIALLGGAVGWFLRKSALLCGPLLVGAAALWSSIRFTHVSNGLGAFFGILMYWLLFAAGGILLGGLFRHLKERGV